MPNPSDIVFRLRQLIKETSEDPSRHHVPTPDTDYVTLVDAIVQKDLTDEMAKLNAMIRLGSMEEIKERFSALCRDRAEQNQGTFLHFGANPHTLCNTLYFNIAKLLYPEANFKALFKLLLPEVTTLWQVDLHQNERTEMHSRPGKRRKMAVPIPELSETNLDDVNNPIVSMPFALHSFNQLVFSGNSVFPLTEISQFNFELHHQFYQLALSKPNGPLLLQAIQHHNPELGNLYDVIWYLEDAAPLYNVILHVGLTGERFGYGYYDTEEWLRVTEAFMGYYDRLPTEIQTQLNNCTNANGLPFSKVIELIKADNCIEEVSKLSLAILANPANKDVLNISPWISAQDKAELLNLYPYEPGKSIVNLDHTVTLAPLPLRLSQYFHRQIVIDDFNQLYHYLTHFPPETYTLLMQEATINKQIAYELQTIWSHLTEPQRHGILEALIQAKSKWDLSYLLITLIPLNENQVIATLLETFTAEETLAALEDNDCFVLYKAAALNPEVVDLLLNKVSEPQRSTLILKKVGVYHYSALHWAAIQNTASLKIMLDKLSEIEIQAAIDEEDKQSGFSNLLSEAAKYNAASFELLLSHLPQESQHLQLILKKNFKDNSNMLFNTVPNARSVQLILAMYPEDERKTALQEIVINNDMESAIKKIITYAKRNTNPDCMIAALASLPECQRLPMLIATVANRKRNILHLMASDPISLEIILELLPEPMRRPALLAKDADGVNVLDLAEENPESMAVIEELCPRKARNQWQSDIMALIGEARTEARTERNFQQMPPMITNCLMLIDAIYQKELADEMRKLRKMAETYPIEAIREQFSVLCRTRAEQYHGPIHDFTQLPYCFSNKLYWNIAHLLYPEASTQELNKILLPKIKTASTIIPDSMIGEITFPTKLVQDFYPQIMITNVDLLINFLESIPNQEYAHFLQKATINFKISTYLGTLSDALDATVFPSVLDALIQTKSKWGVANLLAAFIYTNDDSAITALLEHLSAEEVFAALQEEICVEPEDEQNTTNSNLRYTLLQFAVQDNAWALEQMFDKLSDEQYTTLMHKPSRSASPNPHGLFTPKLTGEHDNEDKEESEPKTTPQ